MYATTLSSWARLIWDELDSRHQDANAIFRQAGLSPDQLGDPNARFNVSHMTTLWALAEDATDAGFGVAAGQRWSPTTFHALGFAWLASRSLGDALHRITRYGKLVNDGLRYVLSSDGLQYRFSIEWDAHQRAPAGASAMGTDAAITALITMCRMLLGPQFAPVSIATQHPPHPGRAQLERWAKCPVQSGTELLALTFDRHDVERHLMSGNWELVQAHDNILLKHLQSLKQASLAQQVQTVLIEQLPAGAISEQDVARHLAMSARSLQRRLNEEGTNYKTLLQTTRQTLAQQHVGANALSINEIAYLLGFSDQANFTRAFKRWFGCSPSAYRQHPPQTLEPGLS